MCCVMELLAVATPHDILHAGIHIGLAGEDEEIVAEAVDIREGCGIDLCALCSQAQHLAQTCASAAA